MSFANDVIDLLGLFSFTMSAATLAGFAYKWNARAASGMMNKAADAAKKAISKTS